MNHIMKILQCGWMVGMFVVFTLLGVGHARAQLAAYGAFSTTSQSGPYEPRLNGGTFGVYYDSKAWPVVNLGGDVRVSHVSGTGSTVSPANNSLTSVLVGPRVSAHVPLIPVRAYVEGLVGEGNFNDHRIVISRTGTALQAGFAVGADLTIFPHLDWRVVDYTQTHVYGNVDTGMKTISTGLVVRLF